MQTATLQAGNARRKFNEIVQVILDNGVNYFVGQ